MRPSNLTRIAVIAALYAVLTVAFEGISYGPVQFRISEMLTVLPFLTPYAIPGLTLGTLVANLFSPFGFYDILLGSLATLIAAWLTWKMPRPWLAPLPPVIVNPIVVGLYVSALLGLPFALVAAQIFVGELVVCYLIGYPLLLVLRGNPGVMRYLR